MERVRLGRTDLTVTRLGWGGIPIQRVSEDEAVAIVKAVIGLGTDLLDTARGYTTSEHRIGLALKQTGKRVVLSTKSQQRTAAIYDDVKKSLSELQVDRIDIYNCHGVSTLADYEKVMAPGGAYEGLKRAQREGLISFLGLTSHSLDTLQKVLEDDHFDVIMTCYSFLEPEAETRIFPLAKAKDVGVLTMKPFSGGVIEDAGAALRYVFSVPGIVPIPGSETMEKVQENWRIFTEGKGLTGTDRARIEAVQAQYSKQFCRRCDYCQPCTQGIPIQMVMGLKSLVKRFGPQAKESEWIRGFVTKATECTECEACLPRCPYQLPIPDLMKENVAWFNSLE